MIGTSYASPTAMRMAAGIRACLGNDLGPLAIRALLINGAQKDEDQVQREIGWGRIEHDLDRLITSDDSTAHIIYQRQIRPGEWIRAPIPIPASQMRGNVDIAATFCFTTPTDPHHSVNYTRAGLEIRFRPHAEKRDEEDSKNATSSSFFSIKNMYRGTEAQLRKDAHKWETVLHHEGTKRGSSLKDPCFDIHYNAREESADTNRAKAIDFALVLTIHCKNEPQLYNNIFTAYRNRLQPIAPIHLPLRLRAR